MISRNKLALALTLSLVTLACGPTRQSRDERPQTDGEQRRDDQDQVKIEDGAVAVLRLLETTDLHVNMESFDYYKNTATTDSGLVRTATLIRRARAEVKNSLLIDNGDLVQGSPLGDWFKQSRDPKTELHSVYKAMNLLGYDAANVGNHEFNYGLEFLEATLIGAKFAYVSSNTVRDDGDGDPANDKSFLQPFVILKRTITLEDGRFGEIKVGVIGFVPPQIMLWDRSNLLGKLAARDIVDTANAMVPRMIAEGADVIVAVPHSGINPNPRAGNDENAVFYLAQVDGIDAILSGHSHQVFPGKAYESLPETDHTKGLIHGVPTVMAGSWGSHLGVVDLTLKKVDGRWRVQDAKAEAREVKTLLPNGEFEGDIREAVAGDHAATLTYLEQEVGTAERPLHTYFSLLQPSGAVQIVGDAQLWYARQAIENGGDATAALRGLPILSATAPLKAGGKPDNFTDVPAGKLTLRNVADLYVYPNTVKVVKITGAQVKDWLEMAAGAFNQIKPNDATEQMLQNGGFPAYNFDQIMGVSYAIDLSQPARFNKPGKLVNPDANRIKDLTYEGQPVLPEQAFLVVTNNYRANGGGFFPGLDGTNVVLDPGRESREALRDYVVATGIVGRRADQGWKLLPVAGATNVIFRTSPRAKDLATDLGSAASYVDTDADGYARFKMNW